MRFIRRAQELGFTLREIEDLIELRQNPRRGAEVRAAASAKVEDIEHRIRQLKAIREALGGLVAACDCEAGTLTCPIIEALDDSAEAVVAGKEWVSGTVVPLHSSAPESGPCSAVEVHLRGLSDGLFRRAGFGGCWIRSNGFGADHLDSRPPGSGARECRLVDSEASPPGAACARANRLGRTAYGTVRNAVNEDPACRGRDRPRGICMEPLA